MYAPPLINKLVGRPVKLGMDASYAKLCNGYIAASGLLKGDVGVTDFSADCLADQDILTLGAKVDTHLNHVTDPNALAPVRVEVRLISGQQYQIEIADVLGSPQNPLDRQAQLAKFRAACKSAIVPFAEDKIAFLIKRIDQLEQIPNINHLVDALVSNR